MSGTLTSTFIPFFLKKNIKKYLSDWVRSYFSPLFSLGVVHGLQCVWDSIVVACRLSMWDLSSPTREQTHVHHIRRQVLNHWTTRKGSPSSFFINATNEEKELAPKSSSAPHGAETWLLGFQMFKRTHAAMTDLIIHSYVQHTHSPKLWVYEGDWNGCNPCFPMISIFFFFVKSGWWNNVVGCGRHWEKWSCTDWKSMPCTCMGFPSGSDGRVCLQSGRTGFDPWVGKIPGEGYGYPLQYSWASPVTQTVKNLPVMWETWIPSLGWDGPWMGAWQPTHILAWRIPMDRGAWWATDCGVAKSRTRLSKSLFVCIGIWVKQRQHND